MKQIEVAIAIVRKGSQVLICQRPDDRPLGGYWEFPGGKLEVGETLEQCLVREVMEEIAIRIVPLYPLEMLAHAYPDLLVHLHPFVCDHLEGEPQAVQVRDVRWIDVHDLIHYRFPEANDSLISTIVRSADDGR